jgi:hypothetical protein
MTALTTRGVRHGVEPDIICQPGTSPGIKTRSSPPLFQQLPPFFPLTLRLPALPPSPTEPIRRGQWEKCHSVIGWILFARRLGSIVSSTVWPVRRPLHNDAGEAPSVPAGRQRLGQATALDTGPLLLSFKLRSPIHHTSRLHRGRPRPCHRCVTTTSSCCRSPLRLGLVKGRG